MLPAPDNHHTTSPNCRMTIPAKWRVHGARGCPCVCNWVVSTAGIKTDIVTEVIATPDDHLRISPHRCVKVSPSWGVVGGDGCPCVRAGIVSRPGVQFGVE